MANRPPTIPTFCTANPAGRVQPPTSLTEAGFTANTSPAAEHLNWLLGGIGDTLTYLDSQNGSLQLASTLDSSCRLIGGGVLSWAMGTRVLAWDAALYVAIPSQPDAANAIASGSVAIADGSVGYVSANVPFSTTAATTAGSPVLSAVLYADLVRVGMSAAGAGIPANAAVQSVDASSQTVTLSAPATATAGGTGVTFTSSGALTVKVAPSATFIPGANDIIIARATASSCHVGVNAATLRLHDKEAKQLGEDAYLSVTRPVAGVALGAGQAVYLSQGAGDTDAAGNSTGRTLGQLYPADASASFKGRAGVAGFVASDVASGAAAHLVSQGIVTGLTGLTTGAVYWLSATTPGAITLTAPAAAGTYVVPVGVALSPTRLLVNPAAAVQARTQDLALAGTLSANSVVSAQGLPQAVSMGYYTTGNTSPASQFTFFECLAGGSSPIYMSRSWFAERPGSVLALKVTTDTFYQNDTTIDLMMQRGTVISVVASFKANMGPSVGDNPDPNGVSISQIAAPGASYFFIAKTAAKGVWAFKAGDVLSMRVTTTGTTTNTRQTSTNLKLRADMTVEMAS